MNYIITGLQRKCLVIIFLTFAKSILYICMYWYMYWCIGTTCIGVLSAQSSILKSGPTGPVEAGGWNTLSLVAKVTVIGV